MKKQILIIPIIVLIVTIFVSCSADSGIENISTTAVTDSNGTTHYYEPVTDDKGNISTTDKNQGVFAEIETQSNGKAVTKKDGKYVTNEYTTVLPLDSVTDDSITTKPSTEKSSSDTTKNIGDADNVVEFEPAKTTEETKPSTTTTTKKETTNTTTETAPQKNIQSATDKDGWIKRWY